MKARALLTGMFVIVTTAGPAHTAPGDAMNGGTVPPDSPGGPVARCELRLGQEVSRFTKSILRCHRDVADGKLAPADEKTACEEPAAADLAATSKDGCEACTVDEFDQAALSYRLLGLDSDGFGFPLLPGIYCAGTVPFGGYGGTPGYEAQPARIPPDSPHGPVAGCERRVAKAVTKLFTQKLRCRRQLAASRLHTIAEEDECNVRPTARFLATSTDGCDPCTNLAALEPMVTQLVKRISADTYCAVNAPCDHTGQGCACEYISSFIGMCQRNREDDRFVCSSGTREPACEPDGAGGCQTDDDCTIPGSSDLPRSCIDGSLFGMPGHGCCVYYCP